MLIPVTFCLSIEKFSLKKSRRMGHKPILPLFFRQPISTCPRGTLHRTLYAWSKWVSSHLKFLVRKAWYYEQLSPEGNYEGTLTPRLNFFVMHEVRLQLASGLWWNVYPRSTFDVATKIFYARAPQPWWVSKSSFCKILKKINLYCCSRNWKYVLNLHFPSKFYAPTYKASSRWKWSRYMHVYSSLKICSKNLGRVNS